MSDIPTLLCDEPTVLELLTRTFDGKAQVLAATSVPQALELLRTRPVDVLITGKHGLELVLAARAEHIEAPAILFGHPGVPGDDATVFGCLPNANELQLAVKGVLELAALRREREWLLELIAVVSHELRTPLTAITGALDLVLGDLAGELNEKQRRFLDIARESTATLHTQLDDLIDLSSFAEGRLKMSFEPVLLVELVRGATEKYAAAMREKGITCSVAGPSAPLRVHADPNRLSQVLNNLLTNAVKFTPEGGAVLLTVSAAPGAEVEPGFATVSVWNSGEPIAEQNLERIFDRFVQARSARNRTVPGTGLGLSISRSIIEAHGGRIWAEPSTDGARFVVAVPLAIPSP